MARLADSEKTIWELRARVTELEEQLEALREALIYMRSLASVANDGDPWYAEEAGLPVSAIFEQAREALGESNPASEPEAS